jgi:hypothetical protein
VESHQHAQGFKNGGFSLRIVARQDRALRRHLKGERVETAEIHQTQRTKHRQEVGGNRHWIKQIERRKNGFAI